LELKKIQRVYLIGIGGIGMSAIARYFNFLTIPVSGYDKAKTPLIEELITEGISVFFEDKIHPIPEDFLQTNGTLIVYTPAIPLKNKQFSYFLNNGFIIKKRSEVLGIITKESYCLAVAGTHGKTTTSAILAHLLKETGIKITAFLGGISENINSNFILESTEYAVVEADEFDRSFLQLSPTIACITSMDADHLDVYGDQQAIADSFRAFSKLLKPKGKLFVKSGLPLTGITYGIEDNSDFCIRNISISNGSYFFDIKTPTTLLENVTFNKPGRHNLLNCLAAFAMAAEVQKSLPDLVQALATFKGVMRRFSYQIKTDNFIFIDDYAHHPIEIDAVYQAVEEMHPNKKVLAIFQPHLYSRTRDFGADFAKSLSRFANSYLLEIYPAREAPIPGITSSWLLDQITSPNKKIIPKIALEEEVKKLQPDILLTMGAGDIGILVKELKKKLDSYEN